MPIRKRLYGRTSYSTDENKAIFLYALKNQGKNLLGTKIWKLAEEIEITNHSWKSMKNHYRRAILPRLNDYIYFYGFDMPNALEGTERSDNIYCSTNSDRSEESITGGLRTTRKFTPPAAFKNRYPHKGINLSMDRKQGYAKRTVVKPSIEKILKLFFLRQKRDEKLSLLASVLPNLDLTVIKWLQQIHQQLKISYEEILTTLQTSGGHAGLALERLRLQIGHSTTQATGPLP